MMTIGNTLYNSPLAHFNTIPRQNACAPAPSPSSITSGLSVLSPTSSTILLTCQHQLFGVHARSSSARFWKSLLEALAYFNNSYSPSPYPCTRSAAHATFIAKTEWCWFRMVSRIMIYFTGKFLKRKNQPLFFLLFNIWRYLRNG